MTAYGVIGWEVIRVLTATALGLAACGGARSSPARSTPGSITEVTEPDPNRIILRPRRVYAKDEWVAIPEKTGSGGERISGDINVQLPDHVKRAMAANGLSTLELFAEVCRDQTGRVERVSVLHPTLPTTLEAYWQKRLGSWVYSPFVIAGQPTPVCTLVVFNYVLTGPGGPSRRTEPPPF